MGQLLIIVGLLIALAGLLSLFNISIPFGQLPGDIVMKGKNVSFYFPIVSMILLSLLISFLFYLINFFR